MPSVLESLTSLLGEGDTLAKLGSLLGEDAENTSSALEAAGPALIGGLAEKATSDGGADEVTAMLDDADSSILDDLGGFLDGGDDSVGTGMLDGIFGNDRGDLLDGLAGQSGLGAGAFTKLLPMLTPMLMGLLAKLRTDDGLDGDGVVGLLSSERDALESDGKLGDWFGKLFKGGGALAALGGAAALAKDKLDDVGDKVDDTKDDVAEKVDDAMDDVGDKVDDAKDDVAEKVDDAKDAVAEKADDAKDAVAEKVAKGDNADVAKAAAVTATVPDETAATTKLKSEAAETREVLANKRSGGAGGGRDDDRRGPLGWLWWALGAVLLVAILAWLLSQCGDNDEDTDAGGGATTVQEADADADGGATDGDADAAGNDEDADGEGEDSDGDAAMSDVDLQAELDAVLDDGVTGVVDGDVATLSGTVESEDAKSAAEEAALAIEGIGSVDNQIEVEAADDADSAADLQGLVDAALADAAPDGASVSAELDGPNVTLTGSVDSEDVKAALEAAVSAVEGVESVDNQLELSDGDPASDDAAGGDGSAMAGGTNLGEELGLTPITFEYRSAQITGEGEAVLAEVVAYLEANDDVDVEIQGHTDSDGTDAENVDLSTRRAESVKTLLEANGVAAERLSAVGLGESEPKIDNDTAENKAINRRIEFLVAG